MDKELLRINILSIAGAGLLMLVSGVVLYAIKGSIGAHMRFFLPIPPLGVAAYVLAFNVFRHYNGRIPETGWLLLREVALGSALAAVVFASFSFVLLLGIRLLQKHPF